MTALSGVRITIAIEAEDMAFSASRVSIVRSLTELEGAIDLTAERVTFAASAVLELPE